MILPWLLLWKIIMIPTPVLVHLTFLMFLRVATPYWYYLQQLGCIQWGTLTSPQEEDKNLINSSVRWCCGREMRIWLPWMLQRLGLKRYLVSMFSCKAAGKWTAKCISLFINTSYIQTTLYQNVTHLRVESMQERLYYSKEGYSNWNNWGQISSQKNSVGK